MASGAAGSAAAPAAAFTPGTPEKVPRAPGDRRKKGKIDYDHHIEMKKLEMKELGRVLKKTKADSRNEKRKKQRLVRKAASLTVTDLHRIAALKKAGIWDPGLGLVEVPCAAADGAAARPSPEVGPDPAAPAALVAPAAASSTPVALEAVHAGPGTPVPEPMSTDAPETDCEEPEAAV